MPPTNHPFPPTPCPTCGQIRMGSANADGYEEPPAPGDIAVCDGCGTVLLFTSPTSFREMTEEELADLPADALQRLRGVIRMLGF